MAKLAKSATPATKTPVKSVGKPAAKTSAKAAAAPSARSIPNVRSTTEIDVMVGQRIRIARKLARQSQMFLGEAIGVTYQQVQKYENGTDRVAVSRLLQIATALGTDAAFLMGQDDGTESFALPEGSETLLACYGKLNATGRQLAVASLRALADQSGFVE